MAKERAKTIASNTITMYARTILTMIITLYSSRVILKNLGVEDFGVYNIVGGVVTLLSVLTNSLSRVSVRFISYEMGKTQNANVQGVFSLCVIIHLCLFLILFLLGLLLKGLIIPSLNIPPERAVVAETVFIFSVITFGLNVLKIPFDSMLISCERMKPFAIFGIFDSLLKLSVAIIIGFLSVDRLCAFSWLLSIAALLLLIITVFFCWKSIPFCRISKQIEKKDTRQYFSFIGWSVLGGSMEVVTVNAFVIVVNIYYGVLVNAAIGIMNQVQSAVTKFLSSFSMSYTPPIIKAYADEDMSTMRKLICSSSKISFILITAISVPLIINMETILNVWLTEVPQYTSSFCRAILICTMIDALTSVYNTSITATGRIKTYNILLSISYVVNLILTIIIAYNHINPTYVILSRALTLGVFNMFIGWYTMKKELNFDINYYLKEVFIPILLLGVFTAILILPIFNISSNVVRLLISIIPFEIVFLILAYKLALKDYERELVSTLIISKLKKKK